MKKWLILPVLLAAGALGYYYWNTHHKATPVAQNPGRPATATIEARNISFILTSAGDIGPADQVSVRPEINGKISVLPVDIGDQVKKGELLFALDDTDLQSQRSSCLTDIEGTKLQVQKCHRNYDRSEQLYQAKLISQETYEDTKTDFQVATNTLEKAEKALRLVDDQLSKTRIVAPFDCTILTRPVSMGQAVSGSGGFNAGTEVLTIANLHDMIVNAHVNQADVTRMVSGQVVDLEVEAVPGLKFKGTVSRIAPQATLKNNIKGFAAQILLKDIDPRVRPGMTANLSIPLASAENVVAVPLAAVFTEMNERYVYVKKDDAFEIRMIRLGVVDYQFAEVLDGLKTGEVVSMVRPPEAAELKMPPTLAKPEKKSTVLIAPADGASTNRAANVGKRAVL